MMGDKGSDTLVGGGGNDIYTFSFYQQDGYDAIYDEAGNNDAVYLQGISISDLGVARGSGDSANDLIFYSRSDYKSGIMTGIDIVNYFGASASLPQGYIESIYLDGKKLTIG